MLDTLRYVLRLAAETCLPAAGADAPRAFDYAATGLIAVAIGVAVAAFVLAFLRGDDKRARRMAQMPVED